MPSLLPPPAALHRTPPPHALRRRGPNLAEHLLEVVFALLVLAALLLLIALCPGVSRAATTPGECDPPRTRVALFSLADGTDHAWEAWTGIAPGPLVTRMLADSLGAPRGRDVVLLASPHSQAWHALDDGPALERARAMDAQIVVTGTIVEFLHEDRREGGKLWRWNVGAPDSRSRARVRIGLRVLDARDGSVIIETAATRERTGRATATVDREDATAIGCAPEALLGQALAEALSDLVRTIGLRLAARWQARVESVSDGTCLLDAGDARGHFTGQHLEVWRTGIETYDQDLVRISEDVRVGVVQVTAVDPSGYLRARLLEGEALPGDRVRACSGGVAPALSARR